MEVPGPDDPAVLLALNLAGTFAFGLSGGLAAVRARLDLFGVVVLALVVALAGGVTRDVLIGVPPAAFRDWEVLVAAGAAGALCCVAPRALDGVRRGVLLFDAVGLAVFSVTGAATALAAGLGPAQAVLLGAVTGIGGGILRDVLLREVPTVLRQDWYAVPALLGAGVFVVARELGVAGPALPVAAAAVCLVARLAGLRLGLRVPTAAASG